VHPILFSFGAFTFAGHVWGPYNLNTYGLMMAMAFLVSVPLLAHDVAKILGPKVGLSSNEAFQRTVDLFVWIIPASLVGGRLFYVLENHAEFHGQWLDAFKIWQGGLVFYGGLVGAIVAALVWMRSQKWPVVLFLDIAAPYILLKLWAGWDAIWKAVAPASWIPCAVSCFRASVTGCPTFPLSCGSFTATWPSS
jgi:phosphatidylglycerol:prolipoprotein diacylglycerol transferase